MKNTYKQIIAPAEYPGKRYSRNRVLEHHYIWWAHTGESILYNEIIHHIDGNKQNNNFNNLQKMSVKAHAKLHAKKPDIKNKVWVVCAICGKAVLRKISKPGKHCSRKCNAVAMHKIRARSSNQVG